MGVEGGDRVIKVIKQMPIMVRGEKIKGFAKELEEFIALGAKMGEYVVENKDDRASTYQGLKNAARLYGLTDQVEVLQRNRIIIIRRKDLMDA